MELAMTIESGIDNNGTADKDERTLDTTHENTHPAHLTSDSTRMCCVSQRPNCRPHALLTLPPDPRDPPSLVFERSRRGEVQHVFASGGASIVVGCVACSPKAVGVAHAGKLGRGRG